MASIVKDLSARLQLLPPQSGVYLIKGHTGKIIYIGKAKNLRNRVRSYFTEKTSTTHFAAHILKKRAGDIDWIITSNEVEALILEANLIRTHKPRYNVELKDDKHFPYLKVSLCEPFPRITITRKITKGRDLFFGPYTNAGAMRKTRDTIYKIFRIRDCKLELPSKKKIRPCLTYDIGRCDAPCAGLCTEEDYGKLVDEAILLLKGKNKPLMQMLHNHMTIASKQQQYEEAARIRDQIKHIDIILKKQKVDLGADNLPRDLIAVAREGRIGCAVILQIREGVVTDKKSFELTSPLEQDETELITHFLKGFYQEKSLIPKEVIVSHQPLPEENLESIFGELRGSLVGIKMPEKGVKKRQMALTISNARMILTEYISQHEKKNRLDYTALSLQEDLRLPRPPKHIEAFDISHLSGTDTVASMVAFIDGKPRKQMYRKYTIKTVAGIDDFASMGEVLDRRIRRIIDEKQTFPDLFLIDGGKGQLSAAVEILRKYKKEDQPIIGLAKRLEEVFKPGITTPFMIPKTSASLKLIQHIRNESHRFAITFQKSKRKKYVTKTWLDEIPGVGPKTRQKLLKYFKTPSNIRSCPFEELASCIGPALAKKVRDWEG